jgi:hypothetical protein
MGILYVIKNKSFYSFIILIWNFFKNFQYSKKISRHERVLRKTEIISQSIHKYLKNSVLKIVLRLNLKFIRNLK